MTSLSLLYKYSNFDEFLGGTAMTVFYLKKLGKKDIKINKHHSSKIDILFGRYPTINAIVKRGFSKPPYLATIHQRSGQGACIDILELTTHRNASSNSGDFNTFGFKHFTNVVGGSLTFTSEIRC